MVRFPILIGSVLLGGGLACAAPGSPTVAPASRPDAEGVRAVENAWSEAFVTGDAAFLDTLLDPQYVSVNQAGVPRPKAAIIAAARAYAAAHPGSHADPMSATSQIDVRGRAAVVTHRGATDRSVDMFYYARGSWHAWYSQHTAVQQATEGDRHPIRY